jgi:SAM-dependent methyltransferase
MVGAGLAATECLWCGSPLGADADRLPGRTRCGRCGAATTDPLPTGEELEAAYGDWYRPDGERRFSFAGDAILRYTRGRLASRIDEIAPDGPVIDVGAGDGTLVDELRACGREATGLERGSLRADFRDEPLSAIDGEWAAIIFWHSLEHLPDSGDAVRHAGRLLKPGGVIAIAVPNNDSLQARVFGDRWLHLDLPRHLIHLTAGSLEEGLGDAGLTIERISFVRAGQIVIGWLHGLVGKLPGRPNLYQALRRRRARSAPQPTGTRLLAIAAALLLLPFAVLAAIAEIILRRAGTVYMEARHG